MEIKLQIFAPKITRCDYSDAVTELSEPILSRAGIGFLSLHADTER